MKVLPSLAAPGSEGRSNRACREAPRVGDDILARHRSERRAGREARRPRHKEIAGRRRGPAESTPCSATHTPRRSSDSPADLLVNTSAVNSCADEVQALAVFLKSTVSPRRRSRRRSDFFSISRACSSSFRGCSSPGARSNSDGSGTCPSPPPGPRTRARRSRPARRAGPRRPSHRAGSTPTMRPSPHAGASRACERAASAPAAHRSGPIRRPGRRV